MPDVRIVSTYNPAAWGDYVRRNVRSWVDHVPAEIVLYHEEPAIQDPALAVRVVARKWQDIPGAVAFIEEAEAFPPACGRFGGRYDYNYDAAKFSRKVFAQCDAAEELTDILVWLDSDVEVLRDIEPQQWEEWLMGAPMARFERPGYHSETGVVVWDMRRSEAREFFPRYRALYHNRRVYCLTGGWHDCWALDFVADQMKFPTTNLTRASGRFGPGRDLEVVSKSEVGQYLRHDKGARKPRAA